MKTIYTNHILNRLEQLIYEVNTAPWLSFYDRLREFKRYCDNTPALASCLTRLPESHYDVKMHPEDVRDKWPEGEMGIAYRWDAICQMVEQGPDGIMLIRHQLGIGKGSQVPERIINLFLVPVYDYLVHQVESASTMLYLLLRYKCWAEWFEVQRLRELYEEEGEQGLDRDLRCFLFESGIDYPLSQPDVAGGRVDIVAGLSTGDPLVLEVKVWDSGKNYRENRVRDGLRQVMEYAAKYGKDRGYVVMFNYDPEPLVFRDATAASEWPAKTERGGVIYYFLAIDIIPEYVKPVSERDKGKLVKVNEIQLADLWDSGSL